MNRYFIVSLAVVVCLCGCQKSESNRGDGLVRFSFAKYNLQTKENIVAFPTAYDIGVFAWKSADDDSGKWAASPELTPYMTNVNAVYNSGESAWLPVEAYRWPLVGHLHFLCYSPYKSEAPVSWDGENGLSVQSYVIPSAADEDFCYSDITVDQKRDPESSVPADILMRHALCKVSFNVTSGGVPSGLAVVSAEVEIDSIVVSNILDQGSFSAANAGDGTWESVGWANLSGGASYVFDSERNGLFLMPQTLVSGGDTDQQFTITYTANVTCVNAATSAQEVITFSRSETHPLHCDACPSWAINQHIRYNLTLNLFDGDITFSPELVDWEDTTAIIKIGYEDASI